MVKKIGIVVVGAALVAAHCLIGGAAFADSYTQDGKPCPPECVSDSMEIVTWYPSPYNEYEELRLYPKRDAEESQCNSFEQLGLMYYNQDQQALKVCRQDPQDLSYSWKDVTLGGGYWQLSGNDIFNTNSGKVGIGTMNPASTLQIVGPSSTGNNETWYPAGLVVGNSGGSTASGLGFGWNGMSNYGWIEAAVPNISYNNIVLNPYGGNVGIRTAEPKSEIQIGPEPYPGSPNIGSLNMFANRGGRTYGHNIYFNLADLTYRRVTGSFYPTWIEMDSDNRGDIIFHTLGPGAADSIISSAELSGAPKMTIKNSGNVGIGTINPEAYLQVGKDVGGINHNGLLVDMSANPGYYVARFQSGFGNSGGGNLLEVANLTDTKFIIDNWGKFYMNGSNPGYKLTVNGSAYCTGIWAGSDLRWKKNIVTLPDPLERISRLRGVEFDWKQEEYKDKNFPEGRQIGIIAQELEKEFPELVSTDNAGYKSIAYDKLTAVLLEAVKEQQAQMRNQQKKIEILELKLKELDEKK